jgi:hypothetical protein
VPRDDQLPIRNWTEAQAKRDAETLAMLNRAQPVLRPPAQLSNNELSFVVPVRFYMK